MFSSLKRGITQPICMLCFVLMDSVLLNLWCVSTLFGYLAQVNEWIIFIVYLLCERFNAKSFSQEEFPQLARLQAPSLVSFVTVILEGNYRTESSTVQVLGANLNEQCQRNHTRAGQPGDVHSVAFHTDVLGKIVHRASFTWWLPAQILFRSSVSHGKQEETECRKKAKICFNVCVCVYVCVCACVSSTSQCGFVCGFFIVS